MRVACEVEKLSMAASKAPDATTHCDGDDRLWPDLPYTRRHPLQYLSAVYCDFVSRVTWAAWAARH
jgi:hypothetical protein